MKRSPTGKSPNETDQYLNPENFSHHYDYIIVGAGSAGSVLAHRLINGSDAKVLVLEAGGSDANIESIKDPTRWPENIGTTYDWNYFYQSTSLINNRDILIPRGKVLGGSGSINAMVWARGDSSVFDSWAAAGNIGWDYRSILPLFKKTEDWGGEAKAFRGKDGPIHVHQSKDLNVVSTTLLKSAKTLNIPEDADMNDGQPHGAGPLQINIRNGKRDSPADAFLRPVLENPNLTVLTGALVQKLIFEGKRCVGVSFTHQDKLHEVYSAEEVLLTAGAIDSPRILMLSGIGDAHDLENLDIEVLMDLPGVGKNLQDHPLIAGICFEANEELAPFNNNLGDSAIFWKSSPDLDIADLMLLGVQIPFMTPEIQASYPAPKNTFTILTTLVQLKSRGYIKMLSNRADGPLEIQPNFLKDPADVEALLKGMELAFDLAEQPDFKKLINSWVSPQKRLNREEMIAFLRESCSTYFHPVGTCAMGNHTEAVVNSKLQVHGIEGLRIADASIMPSITSANTQAPTMMIAELAAEQVLSARKTNIDNENFVKHV